MVQRFGFPGGSVVKNLPSKQEKQVRSPGQEDPLEEEMATHSSILAWEISWTEEPGGLQSMGSQRVRHDLATKQQLSALEITQVGWPANTSTVVSVLLHSQARQTIPRQGSGC